MTNTAFNFRFILKFLGYLLGVECIVMLMSAGIACLYDGRDCGVFLQSAGITFIGALLLSLSGLRARNDIGKHESFVIVTMVWVLFSLFGAIPFYLSGHFESYTDAFFESMSGFSTTGSSVLPDVEILSPALHFWRSIIQWLGGMGIIMLSLAVMPLLKLGGYQLFTAEVTGPVYEKLHPRLRETAKRMWLIYVGLTLAETALLYLGPMDFFDAMCHAFTTMASGGFSTKNASIGYWDSTYINLVTTVFMFLAGTSFVLIFRALTGRFDKIRENEEFHAYVRLVVGASLLLALLLIFLRKEPVFRSVQEGFFHVISILTTTGFYTTDFSHWQAIMRFLLLILMCCGAMSGSTSGNMKIGRILICFKSCFNEMKRDVHPNAVLPVMYNGKALQSSTVSSLFGFLFLYIILMVFSTGLFFSLGMNMEEAAGIALTSLGNIGPGLGKCFTSFVMLPGIAKWWMTFLMLVGRLEIYTVVLLFSRDFWRN